MSLKVMLYVSNISHRVRTRCDKSFSTSGFDPTEVEPLFSKSEHVFHNGLFEIPEVKSTYFTSAIIETDVKFVFYLKIIF